MTLRGQNDFRRCIWPLEETLMSKLILALALVFCFAQPAQATWLNPHHPGEDFIMVAGDALFTRPFTLAMTVVGMSVYLVTLPFTFYAKDPATYEVLVKAPARATFVRCLGCNVGESVR
jgi:hypothetical protein